jgi:alkylated DNA repair dioxygenase AlkB
MSYPQILYNYITEETEKNLISYIDQFEWSNELKRRTQQYGYKYNYRGGKPSLALPIPKYLDDLGKSFGFNFNQCIINEYIGGQGIAPHIDSPIFDDNIVILSLGNECVMDFTNEDGRSFSINLVPRSAMLLTGEFRYNWKHGIKKVYNRRISVTYRWFKN